MADQMLSSVTNFLLGLLVARAVGPREFGAFGLAYATYALSLGASRALVSEPLVVRFSTSATQQWRNAVVGAGGASLTFGIIVGSACLLVALVIDGPLQTAFAILGIALPGLLLQDAWRFAFFALGRGSSAFNNDLVWVGILFPGAIVLLYTETASMAAMMGLWAVGGWAAAVIGLLQTRAIPRPTRASQWLHEQRDLALRFFGEFAVSSGATHSSLFLIGALTTLSEVGRLRAGQMLLGPLNIIFLGAGLVAVAEASRFLRESPEKMLRITRVVSGLLTGGTGLWVLIVLLLPDSLGDAVMGKNWSGGRSLVVPLSIGALGFAIAYGAMTGLRALAAARASLRARTIDATATLILTIAGAVLSGATGVAWGYALAGCLRVPNWWLHFKGARRLYTLDRSAAMVDEAPVMDPGGQSGIV
jgi:O-antigen/teichoic acid export membrane protein